MPTPPAKLLVPRKEAEEKITGLIKKAQLIFESTKAVWAPTPDALFSPGINREEADREKWAKFAIHLLKTLFTDDSIAREFGDSWLLYSNSLDKKRQLADWIRAKIVRLESVVQRLPLFSLAEEVAKGTAVSIPKLQTKSVSRDIFIVHGHDEAAKHEVARFIEKLGLHPIILHEKPDKGRTVIEKVEQHSDVGFTVVLLTPDDMGHPKDKPAEPKPRARQNVVLELGYFIGILGRARVCALKKGDIEIPTDFSGVLYTPMDDAGAWQLKLAREIKAAGIDVDLSKLT